MFALAKKVQNGTKFPLLLKMNQKVQKLNFQLTTLKSVIACVQLFVITIGFFKDFKSAAIYC